MFERLTERLQETFRSLTGRGVLTEGNISDAMRDVRRALLEADVNYQVVKEFVARVREKCLGEEVMKSVKPGQQAIKAVSDELTALLGEGLAPLKTDGRPAVIMMVGLHGSGKTTTTAKLARLLAAKEGRKVMLAACDLHRPAAIDQLEFLGRQLDIPVHTERGTEDVPRVAVEARRRATEQGMDVLILDTAGRHQIDETLVQQLVEVKRRAQPGEILLVADAALGQEAVSVAQHFDQALGITGIVLTKLDGDARGGAALSMRHVTGRPIKFVGVGEGLEDLQPFHPERMASRILGMGDVVSLVERAAEHIEAEEARQLEEKLRENRFDLDDFLAQLRRMRKMGGLMSVLDFLPGVGAMKEQLPLAENDLDRIEGILCSMTPRERQEPGLISLSRRQRIAHGSGVAIEEVSQLLKQFEMMKRMVSAMGKGGGGGVPRGLPAGGGGPGFMPGRGMDGGRRGSNFTKSKKERRRKQKHRRR
ncbi:MAG: Signal recognition particle protein [Lentisphaerae bacterium ADurb.BinA184]|nr:MAG: Signal recognition particle protein [Lentisphaerae bacterium ADurb.BinA184]